ncbi:DUF1015 domain-containing protein [bacterium]|nr:DUF1015 domain-containing protein [bacterium]
MAQIFPFRGYRYNEPKAGCLDDLVSDPYDKINGELQDMYYEKSPNNIVRIIKGKTYPNDTSDDNQYTRAAGFLKTWVDEGILHRDPEPSIYVYDQEYAVPGKPGDVRTRKGFVASCRLMSYEEGGVKPHERTLAGPKADRLRLMRATKAQFGQIFMLYPDPEHLVDNLLDEARAEIAPVIAKDRFQDNHKLYRVSNPQMVRALQDIMLKKQLFIADGHHRYETALAYRDEMRGKVSQTDDYETIENRMITFVSFDDPGLLVLPTHRLIKNLSGFVPEALIKGMEEFFELEMFAFSDETSRKGALQSVSESLKENAETGHVIGILLHGQDQFLTAKLKNTSLLDRIVKDETNEDFKRLDVVMLHSIVLEHLLKITKEDLAQERNVEYVRSMEAGVDAMAAGGYQAFFMLNPTKTVEVKNVAAAGIRMPQKSTDFYPKLVTGLVLNKLSL